MLQVTSRRKGNGNELNGSWDELKYRGANENRYLVMSLQRENQIRTSAVFLVKSDPENSFFVNFSIHPRKTTIHT